MRRRLASANEAALQAAEARLRSILQTVPDAMIIIDERGRIESLSTTAERLFGYTRRESVGQATSSVFMPDALPRASTTAISSATCATGERRIIGIGRIVVGAAQGRLDLPHAAHGRRDCAPAERHYFTGFIRDLTGPAADPGPAEGAAVARCSHMSRLHRRWARWPRPWPMRSTSR